MNENHEERIAQLEKHMRIMADLLINGGKATLRIEVALVEAVLGTNNIQFAMGRYVTLIPNQIDPAVRQNFLDVISKGETNNDTLAAMLATAKATLDQFPLLAPLPPMPGSLDAPPGS